MTSPIKICLFTAHSPLSGGGSVIIQSLISNLPGFSIVWKYNSAHLDAGYENGYMGPSIMGGKLLKDIWNTWKILSGRESLLINDLVNKLLAEDCDAYWIISHNEGLRIALELANRQSYKPVHLTFHDDWAGALCARSKRYNFLTSLAKKLTGLAIEKVSSFDVISEEMQVYYQKLYKRKGGVCHRYLGSDNLHNSVEIVSEGSEIIKIGHIGSIYDINEFIDFLKLLVEFVRIKQKSFLINMWGSHLKIEDIPVNLRSHVKLHTGEPESLVIPELSRCNFVYSMYPMSIHLRTFGKTSLPTKLTSYLQVGRPIFGQGPSDSTLANFLHKTEIGLIWTNKNIRDGIKILDNILLMKVDKSIVKKARDNYFGEKNLNTMLEVFSRVTKQYNYKEL